jgi:hypothetical protein
MTKANAKAKPFARPIALLKNIVKLTKNFSNYAQFRLTNFTISAIINIQSKGVTAMRKKYYYEIYVVRQGNATPITLQTKKEKNKWLFDYFTKGDGKWWMWEHYNDNAPEKVSFERWTQLYLSTFDKVFGENQTYRTNRETIIVREKIKDGK